MADTIVLKDANFDVQVQRVRLTPTELIIDASKAPKVSVTGLPTSAGSATSSASARKGSTMPKWLIWTLGIVLVLFIFGIIRIERGVIQVVLPGDFTYAGVVTTSVPVVPPGGGSGLSCSSGHTLVTLNGAPQCKGPTTTICNKEAAKAGIPRGAFNQVWLPDKCVWQYEMANN